MRTFLRFSMLCLASLLSMSVYAHYFEVENNDEVTIYYNITSEEDKTVAVNIKESSYEKFLNRYYGDRNIPEIVEVSAQKSDGGYPISPVPFTAVKVAQNSFWGQRLEASRTVTIPLAFSKCESEGRYKNFERAANPSESYDVGKLQTNVFDDTDVYKTIEGASYTLQTFPDKKLTHYLDSIVNIMGRAQESDGYLYSARTQNPKHPHPEAGPERWSRVEEVSHELYNLGHMIEGAVAHWQATGSRKFLDIAIRYADCVVKEVGPNPGQARVVPGHQIAEMALCKLYLATGQKKYLDKAKYLLDYRGKTSIKQVYSQSHKPVVEQDEAVGHAVRAAYMYAGMADVAALTGDKEYIDAIDRIWDNIVSKKLYITGGIGATDQGEAFGENYQLPNMSAYCETCAAIGNVYVNYRLFLLHGDSKYYDVLERTLYNGLISGVSLDGGGFFYPNPLESTGQHQRQAWFGCACCPSNISRFIPSLPGYVYAVKDRSIYVNLFLASSSTLNVAGKKVALTQATGYPYEGDISIKVDKNSAGQWAMKIRIPGWVRNKPICSNLYRYSDNKLPEYKINVNGEEIKFSANDINSNQGYAVVDRKWKAGDVVNVHFDMEPRTVRAKKLVDADLGQIAVERGPLVYCAEWPDNDFDLRNIIINQNPTFETGAQSLDAYIPEESKKLLSAWTTQRLTTLTTDAQTLAFDEKGFLKGSRVKLTLIPYYAWCHRGSGNMKVWIPQDMKASRPATLPTLASMAKIDASSDIPSINSIADGLVPMDGNDLSSPCTHWWPKENATEWISYTFPQKERLHSSTVYWFDDLPGGGCSVPESWKLYYKDANGNWQAVTGVDDYPIEKGVGCMVHFDPVETNAIKLEVKMKETKSAGVFEWEVR